MASKTSNASTDNAVVAALHELRAEMGGPGSNARPPKQVKIAEVVRTGDRLIVPASLTLQDAIQNLKRQIEYEETEAGVRAKFPAFPWDAALALQKALDEKFGFTRMVTKPGSFFEPPQPPEMISIANGPNSTVQVPWGRIEIPQLGEGAFLEAGYQATPLGDLDFVVTGTLKRKYEGVFQDLTGLVAKYLARESLYQGKAFRIRFKDDDGDLLTSMGMVPEPKFLDLSNVRPDELIFPTALENAVRTSLFTPIERSDDCLKHGIPLKRGVLLAGPFGTGKTLAAYVTAAKAQENGWTFVYCEAADEMKYATRLAMQYQPAVVFCEDIDRTASGRRSAEMDQLLNIIDGIDSKDTQLMVILTTNSVESINPALLRPGRLDAVLNVGPPDAEAAERLIRLYGRGLVPEGASIERAAKLLSGQIPAVIREAVERAKLSAIRLTKSGSKLQVDDAALTEAAETMQMHWQLLQPKPEDDRHVYIQAADLVAKAISNGREATKS